MTFALCLLLFPALAQTRLDQFRDALAARQTKTLLIVKDGRTLYEWYAPDYSATRPHYTASLAKALVGGMSLLVALNDGRMGVDDLASKYIPAWKQDPQKAAIRIRHLATHSSGIEDAEEDHKPHDQLPGWKGAFWRRDPDPFTIAIHQAPVIFTPGARYAYSNPGMATLAYAVTAGLGMDLRTVLHERIMLPLSVADDAWSIGYGRAYELDGLKLYANWGGGSFTARATARVGQLMLDRPAWSAKMTAYAGTPLPDRSRDANAPGSGLCWYTNFDGVWPGVPRDAFAGAGAGHQLLLVVPSLRLVAVRNGSAFTSSDEFWRGAYENFFRPLMEALAPYPPSPAIRKVTFAPESSIVRQAIDSDNWPITWGDDGEQYTAYGDGWGFDPRTDRKLSLGFARISGPPEQFRGVNIRSSSGERAGDGKAGAKASGMLMLDGVLYMWVRNTGNAQLAWSDDHARTWRWGFRFETSFGSPAFLNFGKNYEGARDDYVYTYSQEGPSAYESDDRLVLARVRKDRIRERSAWEFWPLWSSDISRRGPVFTYPGHCQRVDAVYHPGLRRYLLAVGYNHRGGWGIFDAPDPWGPWTTVFHTEDWGLGGTHGYRLPAKWIAPDGRSMWLIFSGVKPNDAFCVRRVELTQSSSSPAPPQRPSPP